MGQLLIAACFIQCFNTILLIKTNFLNQAKFQICIHWTPEHFNGGLSTPVYHCTLDHTLTLVSQLNSSALFQKKKKHAQMKSCPDPLWLNVISAQSCTVFVNEEICGNSANVFQLGAFSLLPSFTSNIKAPFSLA